MISSPRATSLPPSLPPADVTPALSEAPRLDVVAAAPEDTRAAPLTAPTQGSTPTRPINEPGPLFPTDGTSEEPGNDATTYAWYIPFRIAAFFKAVLITVVIAAKRLKANVALLRQGSPKRVEIVNFNDVPGVLNVRPEEEADFLKYRSPLYTTAATRGVARQDALAKVEGRVLPKPKPSIGDKFENAMCKGLDKTLHAMTKAGLADPIIKGGLKVLGAPGAAGDQTPEFLEFIAKSATSMLRGEYDCRATKKSFEERSGKFISEARQDSPMGEELKEVDAFHNEAFVREMEQASGAEFTDGNKVEFLIDGPQSFAKRFELIDNAKESISLMTWHIYEDETGIEMCKRIAAKAREGVEVKVIVDDKIAMRSTSEKTLKVLEEAGVKVIRWNDPENCSVGNHCKLMIVDNEAAVVGGMNPGNVYSHASQTEAAQSYDGPKWRDTDMLVEGPAVIDNIELFAAFWNEQVFAFSDVYDPEIHGTVYADKDALLAKVGKPGKSKAAVVNHVPDDDNLRIYSSILKAVEGATKTIDIENAYFLNVPGLDQLLHAALMRGVEVRILTNSKTSVDEPLLSEPIMKSLPDLVESGAEVYLKKGDTLHSKFMIVDGSFVSVGSLNLHPRSLFYDAEMAMNLIDPDAAATLGKAFEHDLDDKFAQKIDKSADLEVKSTWYNRFLQKYFYDHL